MLFIVIFLSCGNAVEDRKRMSLAEKKEMMKEDSVAFKVAVLPTLDCMPIFLAKDKEWFDSVGVDVRLHKFNAQMDCDTAFVGKSVEAMVTDVVRAERLRTSGMALSCMTGVCSYWQLLTGKKTRVKKVTQLGDKMVAMSRFSATDYLTDKVLDGVKTSSVVFRIQVNDVNICLSMLRNNEMDAAWLPEPQATVARSLGNYVLADSRKINPELGVIVMREDVARDRQRKKQIDAFVKAYDRACDSLNIYGLSHYAGIVSRYCLVDEKYVRDIPQQKFMHIAKSQAHGVRTFNQKN